MYCRHKHPVILSNSDDSKTILFCEECSTEFAMNDEGGYEELKQNLKQAIDYAIDAIHTINMLDINDSLTEEALSTVNKLNDIRDDINAIINKYTINEYRVLNSPLCNFINIPSLLKEDPDNNVFAKIPALPDSSLEYDVKTDQVDNTPHYVDKGIATEPLILEQEDWSTWQWSVLLKLFGLKEAERIKVSDYHLEFYGIEKDRSIKEDTNKLDESIRRQIIIKTQDNEEEYRIANKIHEQLAGNQDYIDSRIVLNMANDRLDDDTKNEVHLYIFNDSETDPEIKI